jgi:hypothetical protein
MEEDPPAPTAPKNAVAIEPAAKPENPALPPASAD